MTIVVAASPQPILQFFGDDGTFLVGGQLFTSVGGVPYPTYADSQGLVQHANPIILNSRGEIATSSGQSAQLYLVPNVTYTFALFDAQSNPIDTPTNIQGIPTSVTVQNLVTSEFIGQTIYPRTDTEKTLGIAPTIFIPVLRFDPMRYGATGSGDPADSNADTAGLNEAILRALADRGEVWLGDNRQYTVPAGTLAYTCSGNRGNFGLRIVGAGWNGTSINQLGGSGALLSFTGATPGAAPTEAPMIIEGFTLNGSGNTVHGIELNDISYWNLRDLQASSFAVGIYLSSALAGVVQDCQSGNNNFGLLATRTAGTGSGCNRNSIRGGQYNLNSTQGIYLSSGSSWVVDGADIESNGTSGDTTTGGLRIVSTIDDEFGAAIVALKNLWFEGNLGQPLIVDNTSGLSLSISDTQLLSGESNRETKIFGASKVAIRNSFSPGALGDIWDITCQSLILDNCTVTTLIDGGVVRPYYRDLSTSAGIQAFGRSDSFLGTLTAVTGSPTAQIGIRQDGDALWLTVPAGGLLGASTNTTAPTITGLAARYTPTGDRQLNCAVIDNSASKNGVITIGASGVITLIGAGGFTASGSKGLPAITVGPYFL